MLARSFHVWVHPVSGIGPYVLVSTDSYGEAERQALVAYQGARPDTQVEIASEGVLVWGPFIKGSRFVPTGFVG